MIKTKLCRKFLLLLTIICFVNIVYSQKKYNYNEYFFPELKIRGSGLSGNNDYMITDKDEMVRKFTATGRFNYFEIENSLQTQRYAHTILDGFYSRTKRSINTTFSNTELIDGNINFYQEFRKFRKPNKKNSLFWETNQFVDISFFNQFDIQRNRNLQRNISSLMMFPIKFGKGRIEPLEGLPLAEFLIDDLINEGLMDTLLSQEKLFELAQKLVTLRNARVFDSRRARIYRLTEASKWFEENWVQPDIKSLAIINDNMFYANVGTRGQGIAHAIGFMPVLYPLYLLADPGKSFGLGLQYELNLQKNISKYWYHGAYLKSSYYVFNLPENEIELSEIYSVKAEYQLNYVPNTRTIIRLNPSFSGFSLDNTRKLYLSDLSFSFTWFVNFKLMVNGGFSLMNTKLVSDDTSVFLPALFVSDNYDSNFYRTNISSLISGKYTFDNEKDRRIYLIFLYNLF